MRSLDARPALDLLQRLASEPLLGPDAAVYLPHLTSQEIRQLAHLLQSGDPAAARDFWSIITQAAPRRRRPLSAPRRRSD